MTPRELVRAEEERDAAAARKRTVAELGSPTGYIIVEEAPMAYWLPRGKAMDSWRAEAGRDG